MSRQPARDEFKVEGDRVTHSPTGKWYEADPGCAEIVNENTAAIRDYRESEIREMAQRILRERVRISERLW